jgi:hypothetical protein
LAVEQTGNDTFKNSSNYFQKVIDAPLAFCQIQRTHGKTHIKMRTKTLLCAAILAAGAATSMAQVYSLNVVGYVNVPIYGGGQYNMIANPLNNANNSITNLFAGKAAEGDVIFRWDVNAYDFQGTQPTYSAGHWSSDFKLNPGEGVWYINNNNDFTNTFVGDVIQGPFTNNLIGGGSYNAVGSSAPIGGSFTNSLGGLNAGEGDTIFAWDYINYDWAGTQPTYSAGHWNNTGFQLPAGSGFIYINNNNDIQWVRNFTVQ